MLRSRLLAGIALAVPLFGASGARADLVPFTYTLTLGDTNLYGGAKNSLNLSATPSADGSSVTYNYHGATATLSLATPVAAFATPGGSDFWNAVGTPIPVATVSGALPPSSILSVGASTRLKVLVTDSATGESGTLLASAGVDGWNDTDSGQSYLRGSAYGWGDGVTLGGHTYTLGGYSDADLSDGGTATLSVDVYVDRPQPVWELPPVDPPPMPSSEDGSLGSPPPDVGPTAAAAPEPSALALAGTAASALGGWVLSRRRRASR